MYSSRVAIYSSRAVLRRNGRGIIFPIIVEALRCTLIATAQPELVWWKRFCFGGQSTHSFILIRINYDFFFFCCWFNTPPFNICDDYMKCEIKMTMYDEWLFNCELDCPQQQKVKDE